MWKLEYNAGIGMCSKWVGSYIVMMDKQETLIHAFDYDPDCFTLTKLEN
jgi:hypothetical protein